MNPDFIPSEKYLIEGKNLEKVKQEIKEWLARNNIEILYESDNYIKASKVSFLSYYEILIYICLLEHKRGTIVIFDKSLAINKYITRNFYNPDLIKEKRKNLIRFLNNKNELQMDFDKFLIITLLPLGFIGLVGAIIILSSDFRDNLIFLSSLFVIGLLDALLYFWILPWNMTKNKALLEYRVEEYKGKIDIE